jgi:hypothetical protein
VVHGIPAQVLLGHASRRAEAAASAGESSAAGLPVVLRAARIRVHEQPESGSVGAFTGRLRRLQRHRRQHLHQRYGRTTRTGVSLHRLWPVPVRAVYLLPPAQNDTVSCATPSSPRFLCAVGVMWWTATATLLLFAYIGRNPPLMTVRLSTRECFPPTSSAPKEAADAQPA